MLHCAALPDCWRPSLLGVSDDTVRRWIDSGRLRASSAGGPATIDGAELAAHAQEIATAPDPGRPVAESARNRFTGLVTRVIKDSVMAQVDLQAGPFRVVTLDCRGGSRTPARTGVLAVASVKSTLSKSSRSMRAAHKPVLLALSAVLVILLPACGTAITWPAASSSAADSGGTITVLAAASLTEAFTQIGKDFQTERPGHTRTFSFGSSATLANQVVQEPLLMSSQRPAR